MRVDGSPFPVDELPLSIALSKELPSAERMRIRSATDIEHEIEVCAFPITGTEGTRGALAIFWVLGPGT